MKIWKLTAFLPAIFWMAVIFGFSGNNGETSSIQSDRVSFGIIDFAEEFFHLKLSPGQREELSEALVKAVRKGAHFGEYMLLAVLWLVGFVVNFPEKGKAPALPKRRRIPWIYPAAVLLVAFYAATDELHQRFVPGRHSSGLDVLLDTAGGIAGALLFYLMVKIIGAFRDILPQRKQKENGAKP